MSKSTVSHTLAISIGMNTLALLALQSLLKMGVHSHWDRPMECTRCPELPDCPLLVPLSLKGIPQDYHD